MHASDDALMNVWEEVLCQEKLAMMTEQKRSSMTLKNTAKFTLQTNVMRDALDESVCNVNEQEGNDDIQHK